MRKKTAKQKEPRPNGRPKGRKNNLTLLREAESEKALKLCTGEILANIHGVVLAVIEKAKSGDMQAAKLLLDRVVPVKKSIEHIGQVSHVHVEIKGVTHAEATQKPTFIADGETYEELPYRPQ